MFGEDTRRAPALRERLLTLIGDPIIPPRRRDRAIALHGEVTANPDAEADISELFEPPAEPR
ncbi:MAG: hypothetical protein R3F65_29580 [bacterium]